MYNADHISTYRFSFSPDSIHLFSCCASTLCLFSTASIRLGTTLCKLCCYTNSSSSPCLIYFHDAFPHYFHWFHPNSRCVCNTAWLSFSLGWVLFAKQSAGATLFHYQLYYLNYCLCSALSDCYQRLALVAAFCAAPSGLCLGPYPTKISCHYPSWQILACLNAFMVQDCSSTLQMLRPECTDMLFAIASPQLTECPDAISFERS